MTSFDGSQRPDYTNASDFRFLFRDWPYFMFQKGWQSRGVPMQMMLDWMKLMAVYPTRPLGFEFSQLRIEDEFSDFEHLARCHWPEEEFGSVDQLDRERLASYCISYRTPFASVPLCWSPHAQELISYIASSPDLIAAFSRP